MILLLHGNNISASRTELLRIKNNSKVKEIRNIDGTKTDPSELTQAFESNSLFGGSILVCIEQLFGKIGKKTKLIETYADIIVKQANNGVDIILWEEKEIGKTTLTRLGPDVTVKFFKLPSTIFIFLEGLKPGNSVSSLLLFSTLIRTEAPELLYTMLVRHVRKLIQVSDHITPDGVLPWQSGRLSTQAHYFTEKQLLDVYKKLIDLEITVKSGTSPYDFKSGIEIIIAEL